MKNTCELAQRKRKCKCERKEWKIFHSLRLHLRRGPGFTGVCACIRICVERVTCESGLRVKLRTRRIHLQHTHIAVTFASWNFLFFSSKTIKNSNGLMRRLHAYAANECYE